MTDIFSQDLPRTGGQLRAHFPAVVHRTRGRGVPQPAGRRSWRTAPQLVAGVHTLPPAGQCLAHTRAVGKGDTVAVMLPNTPPMVEAHFGIPMAGAVLNALNTRLDAETVAFMLDHGEARVVIVDPEFAPVMQKALSLRKTTTALLVIDVEDALYTGPVQRVGGATYDAFVAGGRRRICLAVAR